MYLMTTETLIFLRQTSISGDVEEKQLAKILGFIDDKQIAMPSC